MRATHVMTAMMVAAALVTSACGGAEQNSGTGAGTNTATGNVEITFASEPNPPAMGENTFDVTVRSAGQPVADADVTVEFFMPAMPAMNMAEMRSTVELKHDGNGRYRGAGNVMMSGNWDATVSVKRGGQEIGSRKFPITAK